MVETIHNVLRNVVETDPNKPFLSEADQTITFQEMDQLSDRFAVALTNVGVGKGDRIAILALNQVEWLVTLFAASKIGASLVTLNVRYREQEFEYMLNHSKVKVLVSISSFMEHNFSDFFQSFKDKVPTIETFIFIGGGGFEGSLSYEDLMLEDKKKYKPLTSQVQPQDTIIMIYTSGTTGKPKAAMISHQSILASAKAQMNHFHITDQDVAIGALPLNHVGGITCTLMVALLSKSKVVLIPAFIPELILNAIDTHQATIIGGVPTMHYMLVNHLQTSSRECKSIRLCIAGGSNIERPLVDKLSTHFPSAKIVNLYGLSETSGACVLSNLTDSIEKVGESLGVPIGDYQVKVVGPDRNALPIGIIGELAVKGPGVVRSYYKMPDQTKESFSEDGWLYTGDLVMMDKDHYLYFKGRKKDMYIQGGFNVYPMEIENILMAHPKISMATGIGVPDPFLGEIGVYYIVLAKGESLTNEELKEYCEKRMADYKIPKKFMFVEEIPLTSSGKVQKARLKEMYLEYREVHQ